MIPKVLFIVVGVLMLVGGFMRQREANKHPSKKPRSIYETPTKRDRIEAHRKKIRYIGYAVGGVLAIVGVIIAWRVWDA